MQVKRRKHNSVIASSAERRNDIMSQFMEREHKRSQESAVPDITEEVSRF